MVFVGAGTRLGFWSWSAHEGTVLMSAELELAAWNSHGEKLWTTPVEPPWHYSVQQGVVTLDIMGETRSFPLFGGPRAG